MAIRRPYEQTNSRVPLLRGPHVIMPVVAGLGDSGDYVLDLSLQAEVEASRKFQP